MTLKVGTANLHVNAVKNNPDRVLNGLLARLQTYSVIGVQEAGAAGSIMKELKKRGYKVYDGSGKPGQSSTPIIYRSDMRLQRAYSVQLTAHIFGGVGAGPSWIKPKWLMVCVFEVENGRTLTVANIHGVASVWATLRLRIARNFFGKVARILSAQAGPIVLTGDFNTRPENSVRAPLIQADFISSQLHLGTLPTMGKSGCPDDIMLRARRQKVQAVTHSAEDWASDHRFYGVELEFV